MSVAFAPRSGRGRRGRGAAFDRTGRPRTEAHSAPSIQTPYVPNDGNARRPVGWEVPQQAPPDVTSSAVPPRLGVDDRLFVCGGKALVTQVVVTLIPVDPDGVERAGLRVLSKR